jgi:hypothetical protein
MKGQAMRLFFMMTTYATNSMTIGALLKGILKTVAWSRWTFLEGMEKP